MKKKVGAVLAAAGLLLSISTPMSAHNENFHLSLNGVNVDSQPNSMVHMMSNGSLYVSVDTFAKYYGATYNWDPSSKALSINGKTVNGEAQMQDGALCAPVRALTEALGTDDGKPHFSIGYDTDAMQANVTILPPGVVQISPSVPQMGEHWADPKNLPLGPIYGLSNGKLVFLEYMPAKDLDKTVHDVPGNTVPIPANIDHMDIDWNPQGHEGFTVPHYDLHLYYINRDEQNKIPGGPAPASTGTSDMNSGAMNSHAH